MSHLEKNAVHSWLREEKEYKGQGEHRSGEKLAREGAVIQSRLPVPSRRSLYVKVRAGQASGLIRFRTSFPFHRSLIRHCCVRGWVGWLFEPPSAARSMVTKDLGHISR